MPRNSSWSRRRRRGGAQGAAWLSPDDTRVLDDLIRFLATSAPFFQSGIGSSNFPPCDIPCLRVATVSGNWYDLAHKASSLADLLHAPSASTSNDVILLLTGGRAERLTLPDATVVGGEPLLLQEYMHKAFGVAKARMVLYSGSRITNHNLMAMLHFAKQTLAFERRKVALEVVEEAFLVRRAAAAMRSILDADPEAKKALSSVRFRPAGPLTFDELVAVHGGHADVAFALVLGEVRRLRLYSSHAKGRSGGGSSVDKLLLPAEASILPSRTLDAEVDRLWQVHRTGLYASGSALLANRTLLTSRGAAPR